MSKYLLLSGSAVSSTVHAASSTAVNPSVAVSWPDKILALPYLTWSIPALLALLTGILLWLFIVRPRLFRNKIHWALIEKEWLTSLATTNGAVYLVDLDDQLVRGNNRFYEFLGMTPDQAIGRNIMQLIHGKLENDPCQVCRARMERRNAVFFKEADDPMNRLHRPIEIRVRIIRMPTGEPICILQSLCDLSRKLAVPKPVLAIKTAGNYLLRKAAQGVATARSGFWTSK